MSDKPAFDTTSKNSSDIVNKNSSILMKRSQSIPHTQSQTLDVSFCREIYETALREFHKIFDIQERTLGQFRKNMENLVKDIN